MGKTSQCRSRTSRDLPAASAGWRREYAHQGVPLPDGGVHVIPIEGSRVTDKASDDGDELFVVETHPETTAGAYLIEATGNTVAESNPAYDAGAPVVEAVYVADVVRTLGEEPTDYASVKMLATEGELTTYSFPSDRLTDPIQYGGGPGGDA